MLLLLSLITQKIAAAAGETEPHQEVSDILQQVGLLDAGDSSHRNKVINFFYDIKQQEDADCCEALENGEILIEAIEKPSEKTSYIIAIPSAFSGAYNISYDVFALSDKNNKIMAWPLYDDDDYDKKLKKLLRSGEKNNFTNFTYQPETETFMSQFAGNGAGWCITTKYYQFTGDRLSVIKITETDDCDKAMEDIIDEPRTIILYQQTAAAR